MVIEHTMSVSNKLSKEQQDNDYIAPPDLINV